MSTDDEDLRINTLNALTKASPHVALRDHGHGWLPIGCGNIVLQWVDPRQGVQAIVRVASMAEEPRVWLDGQPLTSVWIRLTPGPHTLAIALDVPTEASAVLAVSAIDADPDSEATFAVSRAGPRWRWTTSPTQGWTDPEFDDTAWAPCEADPSYVESTAGQPGHWQFESVAHDGADVLRMPFASVAVRGSFVVEGS